MCQIVPKHVFVAHIYVCEILVKILLTSCCDFVVVLLRPLASEMAMVKVDRPIVKFGEHLPAKSSSLIYEKNIHR